MSVRKVSLLGDAKSLDQSILVAQSDLMREDGMAIIEAPFNARIGREEGRKFELRQVIGQQHYGPSTCAG